MALSDRCPRAIGFDPRMHVSSKSNSDSYTVADRNSCAQGYPGSCCHSHSDTNAHSNACGSTHHHTSPYPYANADSDSYSDADADPNTFSC